MRERKRKKMHFNKTLLDGGYMFLFPLHALTPLLFLTRLLHRALSPLAPTPLGSGGIFVTFASSLTVTAPNLNFFKSDVTFVCPPPLGLHRRTTATIYYRHANPNFLPLWSSSCLHYATSLSHHWADDVPTTSFLYYRLDRHRRWPSDLL